MTLKNKIILVLFPLVTAIHAGLFSQNNLSLLDENKAWSTLEFIPAMPTFHKTYINKFIGDTLIEGTSYKKIWEASGPDTSLWLNIGFIREDADGKIYARNNWGFEGLIYDFSLEAEDTVIMNNPFGVPFTSTILSVDSVLVEPFGEYRKRLILASADPAGNDETWIEGIGSLAGIIRSGLHAVSLTGSLWDLLCQWDGNQLIYHATQWTACFYGLASVPETGKTFYSISIHPMPVTNRSLIAVKGLLHDNYVIEIQSIFGQKIITYPIKEGEQVQVSRDQFSPGMYIIVLLSGNQIINSQKFFVQ